MPFSPEHVPKPKPLLRKPFSFQDLWFHSTSAIKQRHRRQNHVVLNMQIPNSHHQEDDDDENQTLTLTPKTDLTSLLSDSLLLQILSLVPPSQQNPNSLVCKRWLTLHGRLRRSLKLLDWSFLQSYRLISRFPNLTDLDLVSASIDSPTSSAILLTYGLISLPIDTDLSSFSDAGFLGEDNLLPPNSIADGLIAVARGCPNLRKLALIVATEMGLAAIAANCPTLQELALHRCTDHALRAIADCRNLQILRLVGSIDGIYKSTVSDIGLTILARGCKRLVKLELSGCEGSYDGISAIGKCCLMLEELTICDHRMDGGWIAALSFCGNLKSLRLMECKQIDPEPGPFEYLGSLPMLERLQVQQCQLRDKQSMGALFLVCEKVREIIFHDCWGLDDEMFATVAICRNVKLLSLKGCSLLTTQGLESVVLSFQGLQRLSVVSCNNVKDSEVTPSLSSLFSVLKEFTWRPDCRSVLASTLAGTGMRKKGVRFFKKRT